MSKSQKRRLARLLVLAGILLVMAVALVRQSIAIHNLSDRVDALSYRVWLLETLPAPTEAEAPEEAPTEPPTEPATEPTEPAPVSLGEFKLTAYCPCEKCCGYWATVRPKDENGDPIVYGASGARLTSGVSIAVDPSVIPYGTVVLINGREYIAQDCGGAIKGNRIDVYFDDHQAARQFGVQYAEVYIFE